MRNLARYKMHGLSGNQMPIGGYVSPVPKHPMQPKRPSNITDKVYRQVSECGINFLCATYEIYPQLAKHADLALTLASKYNIKMLVRDDQFFYKNEVPHDYATIAKRYDKHSSFGGIHLCDEPGANSFDKLAQMKEQFAQIFGDKCCYINLFPSYANSAQLLYANINANMNGVSYSYENYIDDYIAKVKPEFLSYDYYPMQGDFPHMFDTHLVQLDLIRRKTLQANIPFWSFIQVTSWNSGVRYCSQAEVMYQVTTALAFGAKGIQYFSYATPVNGDVPEGEGFYEALLDQSGKPTERYYYAQNANFHIKATQEILMNSTSLGIMAIGTTPLEIAKESVISSCSKVKKICAKHAIVGVFDYLGEVVMYIANNTIVDSDIIIIELDDTNKIEVIVQATSIISTTKLVEISLRAGEGALVHIMGNNCKN